MQLKNEQLRDFKFEINSLRNPPHGQFGKFLQDLRQGVQEIEELKTMSEEKWKGLYSMNYFLTKTYADSEEARLKAID